LGLACYTLTQVVRSMGSRRTSGTARRSGWRRLAAYREGGMLVWRLS